MSTGFQLLHFDVFPLLNTRYSQRRPTLTVLFFFFLPCPPNMLPKTQPAIVKLAVLITPPEDSSPPAMMKPNMRSSIVMNPPQSSPHTSLAPCQALTPLAPAAAAAMELSAALIYARPLVSTESLFAINAPINSSGSTVIIHAASARRRNLKLKFIFFSKETPPK